MARNVTLKGFKKYEQALLRGASTIGIEADAEASAAAENIARAARTRAPLDDGNLRASINTDGGNGRYEVTAAANYAAYIEFGTRQKVSVPADLAAYAQQFKGSTGKTGAREAIYEWCRKKNIPQEAWWFIYREIMTNGIRPQPFLFPSVAEEEPKFYRRLRDLLKDVGIVEKLKARFK